MREIFANTGYWIALLNKGDSLHGKGREVGVRSATEQVATKSCKSMTKI